MAFWSQSTFNRAMILAPTVARSVGRTLTAAEARALANRAAVTPGVSQRDLVLWLRQAIAGAAGPPVPAPARTALAAAPRKTPVTPPGGTSMSLTSTTRDAGTDVSLLSLGGLIKGAAKGFLSGGPLGAIAGGVKGAFGGGGGAPPGNGRTPGISGPLPTGINLGDFGARPAPPGFRSPVPSESDVAEARRRAAGLPGITEPTIGCPSGMRPNKTSYHLRDGTFVPKGSRCVKIRRRNPLNPRAASRAIARIESAKRATKMLSRVTVRKKC